MEGSWQEAVDKQQQMINKRLSICKNCGLYLETPRGPICNSNKFINIEDKETVINRPKAGFMRGCACNLTNKTKLFKAKCIVGKW